MGPAQRTGQPPSPTAPPAPPPRLGVRFRRYLFLEIVGFVGLLLAVVLSLAWLVVRDALEQQAWARAGEAADQLTAALDAETEAVVRTGETMEAWWRAGLLDLDAPERLEALVFPLLEQQTSVSSVNLCRADGTSVLLLRAGDAWSTRVIRVGPEGRVQSWRRRERGRDDRVEPWTPTAYDPRTRDWYTRVADTGGPRWSPEAYRFMTTKDPGITFSIPVHHAGALAGVVALDVKLDDLTGKAWEIRPTPHARVTIADAAGRALILPRLAVYEAREARFRDFLRPTGPELAPELAALPAGLAGAASPAQHLTRSAGEPFYVVARPYRGAAGLDWRLAVAIPESDIQEATRRRGFAILALAAIGFVILAWRAHAISERFGRPLDRLASATPPAPTPAPAPRGATTVEEIARLADHLLEEHELLRAKLRDSQRRETIGTLASGVAHDVNNQLTVVLSQLSLALEELPAGHPLRAELVIARDAVLRGAETARALVTYARPTRGQPPADVDLAGLLRSVTLLLARALGRNVRVELELDAELPRVRGHASQLEQVIVNLAMNARDAMPEGGTLAIRAGRGEPGWAVVRVSDQGTGMSAEVRARVFEPWFSTKAEGRGSGLGLPMVQRIIRDHGGRLEVDSAPGQGTRISIWLPAAGAGA